jgi:hypothetical protein
LELVKRFSQICQKIIYGNICHIQPLLRDTISGNTILFLQKNSILFHKINSVSGCSVFVKASNVIECGRKEGVFAISNEKKEEFQISLLYLIIIYNNIYINNIDREWFLIF